MLSGELFYPDRLIIKRNYYYDNAWESIPSVPVNLTVNRWHINVCRELGW